MSQTLLATKKRITSIESTQKITAAMKLVSSVKLKQQMKRLEGNTLFADEIKHVVSKVLASIDDVSSIYMQDNGANKKLYIIDTSTLGLCGSYNFNVYKLVDEIVHEGDDVIIIGTKGQTHYKNSKFNFIHQFDGIDSNDVNKLAPLLKNFALNAFEKGIYNEISMIYTHYKNSITFVASKEQLFPVKFEETKDDKIEIEPLLEPNSSEVINLLVPIYVQTMVLSRLIESAVSEQASRRNAMENATDNAQELVDELKIEYNKARQNAITSQIIEVVSASTNLQGGD